LLVSSLRTCFGYQPIAAALALGAVLAGAGCQQPDPSGRLSSSTAPVIYGEDDRFDVYAFEDADWASRVADFTVALMSASNLDASNPDDIQFGTGTLGSELDLCDGERFADQETAAFCSGALIAPDLVLTAGHCINESRCVSTRFVFDYYMADASARHTVTSEDVFGCSEVIAHAAGGSLDYAVVKLDREAAGRVPASVARRFATRSMAPSKPSAPVTAPR
jgi:hypothetical protein